ncbi:MAG: ABC transporter substrate-binding protein [Bacteroidetes bacterium]|nr:ABC transporter substrate-binding protein [Bacteroidota bacterium]
MKKGLLLFFCTCYSAMGQLGDQSYLLEYKKAVQLFANNQYEEAAKKFSPLCQKSYQNPIVPYAFYYNALNAKNKGNLYQSRVLFRQLFENYYDWEKINEARLIYADINFSENYFEEALKTLELIDDKALEGIKTEMLQTFIPKIKSQSTLKDLYFKFPGQREIAVNLVRKIQQNRFNSKEDLEISDMLTNRFRLFDKIQDKDESKGEENPNKTSQESIDLAVLLPFNFGPNTAVQDDYRYVYDLFQGMKMAEETLAVDGISLKLHAFDIKKSKAEFQNFERKGSYAGVDVFVGPLYAETNQVASDFANLHNIIQVHPISNNLDLVKNKKQTYLLQPSYDLQAKKTLDYFSEKNSRKTASIYFGSSKKDSLFALIYKNQAIERGYKITTFKQFNGLLTKLLPETGHIFFTGDNNLGAKLIQSYNKNKLTCEISATASSFSWDKSGTQNFTNNLILIYPEFVQKEKEIVKNFEKKYFEKTSALPNYFSYLGYDMVIYFGKMLKDGKSIFSINMESGPYKDEYLLSGFDYSHSQNENGIVPLVKFNGETFEEIYR